jgi:hypothetical protein
MTTGQHFPELIQAYKAGRLDEKGWEELRKALQTDEYKTLLEDDITEVFERFETHASWSAVVEAKIWDNVQEQISAERIEKNNKVVPLYHRWLFYAAAVIFLLIMTTTYFLLDHHRQPVLLSQAERFKNDVPAGHEGAYLKLSDGRKISIDSATTGTLAVEGNIKVINENGQLKYAGINHNVLYNEVATSNGRTYTVNLPDHSVVTLNAGSSVRYPLTFTGNERQIEITGEAYVKVAHNERKPFRVVAGGQVIEDIGTEFNINAYKNEIAVKTTLLEGIIKVSKGNQAVILKPGQQSIVKGNITVNDRINQEQVLAWKNGLFKLESTDIVAIMRQVEKWYDVEVTYEGRVTQLFNGDIPRTVSAATLFKVLELTGGVHFKIEGRKVIVMP